MRRTVFILTFIIISASIAGQQLPIYSQYLYNKFLINPAVAGSDGYTSISMSAREQWIGYSGAPRTVSVSMQTRMLKKGYRIKKGGSNKQVFRPKSDGKVGLGGYIFNDKNGLIQRTGIELSYAYHMWLKQETQLSMGLGFTGYHYRINEEEIDFEDPNEPWMNSDLRRGIFVPDVTFGIHILNARYSIGFSAAQLFEASAKIGNDAYNNYQVDRHYYLFGSYDFSSGVRNIIQPSFLVKMSEQLKPQADIGATYIFNEDFWTGLAFRTSGAIITTVGVKYQNLYIGYAFDFTLQEIQRVTYGTHELNFAIKFGDNKRKYRWLDRY